MVRPLRARAAAAVAAIAALLTLAPQPALAATVPGTQCGVLPADNVWNTDISALPVHSRSAGWLASSGAAAGRRLHPDFGGDPYGIPFDVVGSSHATTSYTFQYAAESDPGAYPYGSDLRIEAGSDAHRLVVNQDTCELYETYATDYNGPSTAGSGAVFDLTSNALRPAGWTSADAAGLPILPGLVRRDEVAAGAINHAIRFTVATTDTSYLWPARHQAGSVSDPNVPPMGARFRLQAGYDVSGFGAEAQVVLAAMKRYGLIVADNGSDWFFQGTEDNGWNSGPYPAMVSQLKTVPAAAFEAVDESSLMVSPDSGQARQPGPPPPAVSGAFHPLSPQRLLDTRRPGAPFGALASGQTQELAVLQVAGVPATGVAAVVLNLTAVNVGAAGFLAAFPGGGPWPGNSSLNFRPGTPASPNLVIAQVGGNGRVGFANGSAGSVDLVADVFGYFDTAGNAAGPAGRYRSVTPARLLDTRGSGRSLGPGGTITLPVAGHAGVPAAAAAVALNVTATNGTAPSFLAAYPAGTAWPGTSNLNFGPGDNIPNRVIVPLQGGAVTIINASGTVDVLVDVGGWFTDGSDPAAAGGIYTPVPPSRLLDTRVGGSPLGPGQALAVSVAGRQGVPIGARTAAVNVTVTDETTVSFLAAYPDPGPWPQNSDLNTVPGQTSTNAVLVGLGGGRFDAIHAAGAANLIVDLLGWFS